MAIKRDYYEILGVPRDASDEEIKRAFRRAAQRHHPDIDTSDGAEQRFKELNEAYRVLSDRQRRSAYDMFGHAGVDAAGAGGFEGFGGGFGPFFAKCRRCPGRWATWDQGPLPSLTSRRSLVAREICPATS